jgi:hypothetical protein
MAATVISLLVLVSVFTESKTPERAFTSGAGVIACLLVMAVIGLKLYRSRNLQQRNDGKF